MAHLMRTGPLTAGKLLCVSLAVIRRNGADFAENRDVYLVDSLSAIWLG